MTTGATFDRTRRWRGDGGGGPSGRWVATATPTPSAVTDNCARHGCVVMRGGGRDVGVGAEDTGAAWTACDLSLRNNQVAVERMPSKAFVTPETVQTRVSAKLRLEYVAKADGGVFIVKLTTT